MVLVKELENTFFGAVLNAGKPKLEIKSKNALSITMACLDLKVPSDDHVQVLVETSEDNKIIVCTLDKNKHVQQPLQLVINAGEAVSVSLNGEKGSVHLSGYYMINEECMHEPGQGDHSTLIGAPGGHHFGDVIYGGNHLDEDEDDEDEDDEDDEDDDEDEDDEDEDDEDDDEDDEEDEDEDEDDDDDDEEDEDDEDEDDEEEEVDEKSKKRKAIENGTKQNGNANKKQREDQKNGVDKPPQLVPNEKVNQAEAASKTLTGGVVIKDLREGKGPEAKKGKFIHVYYSGKLKQNGKQFDSCTSGKPFKFRLGGGEVIRGWDIGFENMRVGGKRQIIVPPNMGYGNKRMGNDIPANSTLVFDVELKAVN